MKTVLAVVALFLGAGPALSSDGDMHLVAKHSGKCAQVNGISHAIGAIISQWDCLDQDNVKWQKVEADGGSFFLKAKHSGKCAQVDGQSRANGVDGVFTYAPLGFIYLLAAMTARTCVSQRIKEME